MKFAQINMVIVALMLSACLGSKDGSSGGGSSGGGGNSGSSGGSSGGSGTNLNENLGGTGSSKPKSYPKLRAYGVDEKVSGRLLFSSDPNRNMEKITRATTAEINGNYKRSSLKIDYTLDTGDDEYQVNGTARFYRLYALNQEQKYSFRVDGYSKDMEANGHFFYMPADFGTNGKLDYDYVVYFKDVTYPRYVSNPKNESSGIGTIGIATSASDMQDVNKSVVATYQGSAYAEAAAYHSTRQSYSAKSLFEVNFNSGKAALTLSDFEKLDGIGVGFVDAIGSVKIHDISVSGNSFAGGKVGDVKLKGSDEVMTDFFPQGTKQDTAGTFYGYDNTKFIPDEVGGVFSIHNQDNAINGAFIAD
ncbi:MAG: hypothetical protein ACON45_07710 [Paracoccaceae bacterium]